MPHNMTV